MKCYRIFVLGSIFSYMHMCVSILYVTILKYIYYSPKIFAHVLIEILSFKVFLFFCTHVSITFMCNQLTILENSIF
jgi:hypothetical protein